MEKTQKTLFFWSHVGFFIFYNTTYRIITRRYTTIVDIIIIIFLYIHVMFHTNIIYQIQYSLYTITTLDHYIDIGTKNSHIKISIYN